MHNIKEFCDFIYDFQRTHVSVDVCHNMLLFGTLLSAKPEKVCEIGIGSGYVTRTILYAIKYNGKGNLVSVDNYFDWSGEEPQLFNELRKVGAEIIAPISEKQFVKEQADNSFDFLVSDGDHTNSGSWTDDIFRIVRPNGIIFVHDVFYTESVKKYLEESERLRKPHFLFNESSRADEKCGRGWLMIRNTK